MGRARTGCCLSAGIARRNAETKEWLDLVKATTKLIDARISNALMRLGSVLAGISVCVMRINMLGSRDPAATTTIFQLFHYRIYWTNRR